MSLAVKATIEGSPREIYRASLTTGKRAVTQAITAAGAFVKSNWRSQIRGSGLGNRLANTIRQNNYPMGRNSLNAASLVFSKAGEIVDTFERGAIIRSANGFYLAIPLPAAGKKGLGNQKVTPGGWEARTGRKLTFIYRLGRPSLLVDTGAIIKPTYTNRTGKTINRRAAKNRWTPIFLLVPRVKLPKKLNLMEVANTMQGALPGMIIANWRDN